VIPISAPIPLRPDAGASRAAAVTSLTRAAIATGLQQQCYIVRDGKGQALTYVYFEEEPGRPARLPSC
jgi:hypothetical protein